DGGGTLQLTNSVLRNSYSAGLRIVQDNPTLSSDTFKDNSGAAIRIDLSSQPTITNIPQPTGNNINGLLLDGGSLTRSLAWTNPTITYQFNDDITVPQRMTLTVGAGQVIKSNVRVLNVNGTLNAQGTQAHPVIFTSYRDDSAGGNTDNDSTGT